MHSQPNKSRRAATPLARQCDSCPASGFARCAQSDSRNKSPTTALKTTYSPKPQDRRAPLGQGPSGPPKSEPRGRCTDAQLPAPVIRSPGAVWRLASAEPAAPHAVETPAALRLLLQVRLGRRVPLRGRLRLPQRLPALRKKTRAHHVAGVQNSHAAQEEIQSSIRHAVAFVVALVEDPGPHAIARRGLVLVSQRDMGAKPVEKLLATGLRALCRGLQNLLPKPCPNGAW
mmetsp:Transcript_54605/g.145907  ORF Transcript_54605/g.145907 Transcript_54605/m.145907 type:complete len:230 (-) Transcript_54605:1487-2176(-)